MASLSVSIAQGCSAGAGALVLSSVSPPPGATDPVAYEWVVLDAADVDRGTAFDEGVLPITISGLADGDYRSRVTATDADGVVSRSPLRTFTVTCSGTATPGALVLDSLAHTDETSTGNDGSITLQVSGGTAPLTLTVAETSYSGTITAGAPAVLSALAPRLYHLQITDSSSPAQVLTAEVDVQPYEPPASLDSLPSQWAPVHLPVLFGVRINPDVSAPVTVLVHVETSPDNGSTWQALTSLRRTGAAGQLLQVNLSEYLKAQFPSPLPVPIESGEDAHLWVTYRVLLQQEGGSTFLVTTAAQRALNASVPRLSSVLSHVVFPSVPAGLAHFRTALGASMVQAQSTGAAAGCIGVIRQFVWLNVYGGWDYGLFKGRHELQTETRNGASFRDAAGADRWAALGDVRDVLQVYSDRLTDEQAAVLRGIRRSIQVYERLPSGAYVPVLVRQGSFSEYRATDKTFTVNVTVQYPAQLIQTQ